MVFTRLHFLTDVCLVYFSFFSTCSVILWCFISDLLYPALMYVCCILINESVVLALSIVPSVHSPCRPNRVIVVELTDHTVLVCAVMTERWCANAIQISFTVTWFPHCNVQSLPTVEWFKLHGIDYRRLTIRACERSVSGAENGAERAENGMSGSGAVSGCW